MADNYLEGGAFGNFTPEQFNARLSHYLVGADAHNARFQEADLSASRLVDTNLCGAALCGVNLRDTLLAGVRLDGTDFSGARLLHTNFANVDLSRANGLDAVEHLGPSTVGIDTFERSEGASASRRDIECEREETSDTMSDLLQSLSSNPALGHAIDLWREQFWR